jgi:hypothetical protein
MIPLHAAVAQCDDWPYITAVKLRKSASQRTHNLVLLSSSLDFFYLSSVAEELCVITPCIR